MFTGIVEAAGTVVALSREQGNLQLTLQCGFTSELKVDQSLAHNGVCLTVVAVSGNNTYTVTAIAETLGRTNLGSLKAGDTVNLERCLKLGDRLDGHMVQGHVDQTALCTRITDQKGSWLFRFEYDASSGNLTVQKGSICVNGVSLTVVDSGTDYFTVAIIPYTFEHTNFKSLKEGDSVNLEFDILGKYAVKMMQQVIR
jgi:riboflavin synthase